MGAQGWNADESPATIGHMTGKAFDWRCAEGHHFSGKPNDVVRGKGCKECAQSPKIAFEDSLAGTHPHLLHPWDVTLNGDLTPEQVTRGDAKPKRSLPGQDKPSLGKATICQYSRSSCPMKKNTP